MYFLWFAILGAGVGWVTNHFLGIKKISPILAVVLGMFGAAIGGYLSNQPTSVLNSNPFGGIVFALVGSTVAIYLGNMISDYYSHGKDKDLAE